MILIKKNNIILIRVFIKTKISHILNIIAANIENFIIKFNPTILAFLFYGIL